MQARRLSNTTSPSANLSSKSANRLTPRAGFLRLCRPAPWPIQLRRTCRTGWTSEKLSHAHNCGDFDWPDEGDDCHHTRGRAQGSRNRSDGVPAKSRDVYASSGLVGGILPSPSPRGRARRLRADHALKERTSTYTPSRVRAGMTVFAPATRYRGSPRVRRCWWKIKDEAVAISAATATRNIGSVIQTAHGPPGVWRCGISVTTGETVCRAALAGGPRYRRTGGPQQHSNDRPRVGCARSP
jgi:hypothetical protein